ncbi:hypothetical protein BRARA_B00180 [Brassica rapa]|uniref:Anaphase-promoting complex subunit 1 n=2 Tax=Brassica campestris TaxID=3711 RepID=A0A398ACJ9_BRACM|nr:hypothetical protein BRARA_B00180 [Brassica rapa]
MSPGVRTLTVLGKFKPFGLIAEATDANPPEDNVADSYQYFLFDPDLTGQRDGDDGNEANFSRQREHELFIRDNRIIWTSGSRVLKRFTLYSPIIKACWSHLGRGAETFLCVLQIGCLTIYNTSGEVVSVPLPRTVISIWPLPFGVLLQQAAEVNPTSYIPFSSASPTLGSREMLRKKDMSSHLILRDPLEEPEPIYLEERGKLNIMRDYDERTIWSSDRFPLMTSYNKGKMQHSVWAVECVVPDTVFPKRVSFRRIWQAKGAKKAASKVFLATDDAVPVICFLILEQKKLDIYQYFTQDHESTTVGLMLGLAASYRRTMQPEIAKALFFHVPARYQASYAEFEIPTLLQSAALVSVGILFEGSAHLQTMQLLLGEIGRRSAGDNVLEREGYAVSAGFSLGLVALGRGDDALGSLDSFVNRLLQYLGAKEERSLLAPSNEDLRSAAQVTDGSTANVNITAPGAIIALALMYLKTDSEVIFSKLSIPKTHYELECVRPDFIMLRVVARNLIMWSRIRPTSDWIQSQVPEFVKNGVSRLQDNMDDMYEVDVEALVQAYVNIVAGACISLGLRFAGTRDGNARDLLNSYALYLLNEIKPVSAPPANGFPKGIAKHVDRGTLEMCLYLIVLSLSVVMAGSGDLQIFRLLRFLRSRNSADGHANYGTQMAVSLATGFLFLGGGMRTFSTNNGSLAMLLITLYPRLPSGPNDNRCHLQAFRHLYVLATEARWLQTIDVDSGLPVYAPVEVTVKETELYSETRYCEVTPCILPERAILKRICVCGPRYWPQQVELVPEEKHWWSFGDKSDPFNSGVIYVKRKVGACSYVDDPVGCQSLLSRAMHKVFGLRTLDESNMLANSHRELDSDSVDHLVSTFSSDPSLIAFAQLCCDKSWNDRSDSDFKEFCLQVLFDCISKDRPALLQVYLSLYTTIGSMADLLVKSHSNVCDSLSISSLKVALAYNEAVSSGRLASSSGGFVQSIFLASLGKRCEEILNSSTELKTNLRDYLTSEAWPDDQKDLILLSWYLKWFSVPSPSIIKAAVEKIKSKCKISASAVPLLRLVLPSTHISAIREIDRVFFSID